MTLLSLQDRAMIPLVRIRFSPKIPMSSWIGLGSLTSLYLVGRGVVFKVRIIDSEYFNLSRAL